MKVALLAHQSPVGQFVIDLLSRGGIEAMLNVTTAAFRQQSRHHPFDAVVLHDSGRTLVEDLSLIKGCVDQSAVVVGRGDACRFGTAIACGRPLHQLRARRDELPLRLRGVERRPGRPAARSRSAAAC
jgi:hypothetical protein